MIVHYIQVIIYLLLNNILLHSFYKIYDSVNFMFPFYFAKKVLIKDTSVIKYRYN